MWIYLIVNVCTYNKWSRVPTLVVSKAGLSSLGVPGVPWHTQYLADQLTLFQPGGTDYTHLITTGTPGFSDLPTALYLVRSYLIPSVIFVYKGQFLL